MSPRSTVADPVRDPALDRAEEIQHRAVEQNGSGHASRGELLIKRGLELLGVGAEHDPQRCDPERCRLVSRLLATLAKSTVEIHGVDPALAVMDRSLAWSRCLADPELTAFLISQRALILFRGGRFAAAEAAFDAALAQLDQGGVDLVRLLVNRGALHVEMGALANARSDLNRAIRLARDLDERQFEHIALHNLACLEFTAGDLPEALRLLEASLEVDALTLQGLSHLDRSRVLLAAGLPAEADASLVAAAELLRRDRCWQDLGEVDLTRAEVALLTDRPADARRLAGRARNRFRRHGNDRWRRTAELVLLHADLAAGRPPSRLLPHARRLALEFTDAGFAQQARTAELLAAELELSLGRVTEGQDLLDDAGRPRGNDPIAIRLHTRLVRAESLVRQGREPEARRALAQGLADLAAYQAQFGGIDLQSASAVHGRRLAARDLDLAVRSGRPAAVVAAVERSRAVSGRIRPVTPPADERTAALLTELRRAEEATSPVTGAAATSAGTTRAQITDLQSELRSRSWLNSGSRAWHRPTRLSDLRSAAAERDCDLVTITAVDGRLGAVTMAAGGRMRIVDLADAEAVRGWQQRLSADLDVLANGGVPAAMVAAVTAPLRRSAAELGRLLVAAIPPGHRRIVISPPSGLLALPWSLLPPLVGRPVTVTPSLSGWYRAHRALSSAAGSHPARWRIAAVAGPNLPRARQEANAVARTWASTADGRDLAAGSPADLLDAMAHCRLVHVAAHGVHRGENPMFSSLSLTGGPLFAYELDQRDAVPEHVVLSACEVGQSTVRAGGETLGLTTVLLQLGTASVVAGVARVHDDAAAAMMQRYHTELARGRDAAEALALVTESSPTPNPFVCFGAAWAA
jgi:tetratricopeptide (TPR) repeat protein